MARVGRGPLETARNALAFGRSGGCSAGCVNCMYIRLCDGGTVGAGWEESKAEIGVQEHDYQGSWIHSQQAEAGRACE